MYLQIRKRCCELISCGGPAVALTLFMTLAAASPALAQTVTVLCSFGEAGSCPDGAIPAGNIVRDAEGNIYGTTDYGGRSGNGVVYRLSPSGVEQVLHDFSGSIDGGTRPVGLTADNAGNLYGATTDGGSYSMGTVFKITPAGVYSVLHNFGATAADGTYPVAVPILDAAGNLYGTTEYGGSGGYGTIYKLTPAGQLTILHTFGFNRVDGNQPNSSLTLDSEGNLYGVTPYGGSTYGGTLFEVTASGSYSILYNFEYNGNGASITPFFPFSNLTFDASGNLYGASQGGGATHNGTVYKASRGTDGTWTVQALFGFSSSLGYFPTSGVVFDQKGNMYGANYYGGTGYDGAVFEATADHEIIPLVGFDSTDGNGPNGNLLLDSQGNLLGVAQYGGTGNAGVVYQITP